MSFSAEVVILPVTESEWRKGVAEPYLLIGFSTVLVEFFLKITRLLLKIIIFVACSIYAIGQQCKNIYSMNNGNGFNLKTGGKQTDKTERNAIGNRRSEERLPAS